VNLKVLPSQTLRDANTSPLVLVENPQQSRVVLGEEAGVSAVNVVRVRSRLGNPL